MMCQRMCGVTVTATGRWESHDYKKRGGERKGALDARKRQIYGDWIAVVADLQP